MHSRPQHVYVHVPFCGRRCAYCDFSIAVRHTVPVAEYNAALRRELDLRYATAGDWPLETLYFGGGTPSRLGAEGVAALLDIFADRTDIGANTEVTLEANPEDVSPESAAAWAAAGVNRLSLGSQSFDDGVLTWMHRTHDSAAIGRSVDAARAAGIENISLDLIFALPERTRRSWERDVAHALALEPSHLSLYGLTIESHTPLGRWHGRGQVVESSDERYEAEFLYAHDALGAAGFEHYEVSNFARAGKRSRHNSSYWSESPYAGLGPSAHEFDGRIRRWNARAYSNWLSRLNAGQDPVDDREELTADNRIAEQVYLGLRTTDGLALSPAETRHVAPWVDSGWGTIDDRGRLVLSPMGWLRLDALAADLTLVRSRY